MFAHQQGLDSSVVKYPTAKAGGFYAVPPAERTRKGLRGTLPAPLFVCNLRSGLWALLRQRLAHRTVGSLVLLPKGAYLGTGKHYWVVSVQWMPALGLTPCGLMAPMRTLVV